MANTRVLIEEKNKSLLTSLPNDDDEEEAVEV